MAASERVKVSTTLRIYASFVDSANAPLTGLTPTVRVMRESDNKFLKSDATWITPPGTEYTATALDATNMPGDYYFDFALPSGVDQYLVRFDGGATAANRYQRSVLRAVKLNETDVHKMKAVLCNKSIQTIATGVVAVKDDDASTTLLTLTPSNDSVDAATQNIITPS